MKQTVSYTPVSSTFPMKKLTNSLTMLKKLLFIGMVMREIRGKVLWSTKVYFFLKRADPIPQAPRMEMQNSEVSILRQVRANSRSPRTSTGVGCGFNPHSSWSWLRLPALTWRKILISKFCNSEGGLLEWNAQLLVPVYLKRAGPIPRDRNA